MLLSEMVRGIATVFRDPESRGLVSIRLAIIAAHDPVRAGGQLRAGCAPRSSRRAMSTARRMWPTLRSSRLEPASRGQVS